MFRDSLGKLHHLRNKLERLAPIGFAATSPLLAWASIQLALSRGATRPMMPKPQLAPLEIKGAEVMGIFCPFLLQLDTAVIMALSFPFRNATQADSLVSDISAGMAGSMGEKKGKSGEE